ncbi:MAG: ABC transporter permease [Symbiobacterium sp.]|uniref:ABC transporter permease n=1 Tax=Symbiobacterium sp. TaxID=1971213 RepID=UPI0034645BA2
MITWEKLGELTLQHLTLSLSAVLLATLVAVPGGILLSRNRRAADPIIAVVGMFQTLPAIALLAFMIPLMGIGSRPALAALFLYALLPILSNTYKGLVSVDPAAKEAARGMGMTAFQMLLFVELPLAFRVIMSGIRTSTVLIIGWATLGAYVGAGGLGEPIISGFAMVSPRLILAGGVPVTLMALLADFLLGYLERKVTPRGLQV